MGQCLGCREWLLLVTVALAIPTPVSAVDKKSARDKAAQSKAAPRVFSGPQVGETLPKFSSQRMFGEDPKEVLDPVAAAGGKPVVLIFVHKITRPGIAATRVVCKFLEQKKKSGLGAAVVFLTLTDRQTMGWFNGRRPVNTAVAIARNRLYILKRC